MEDDRFVPLPNGALFGTECLDRSLLARMSERVVRWRKPRYGAFLPARQQSTGAVVPAVADFHHPAARRMPIRVARRRQGGGRTRLRWDVRSVAVSDRFVPAGRIIVPPIEHQMGLPEGAGKITIASRRSASFFPSCRFPSVTRIASVILWPSVSRYRVWSPLYRDW